MIRCRPVRASLLVAVAVLVGHDRGTADPGPYINSGAAKWTDFRGTTFSAKDDKVLGTFLFYWYDVGTNAHLVSPAGDDLTSHPDYDYTKPIPFSFGNKEWWKREITRVAECGIDLVLANYWGTGTGSGDWSNAGLVQLDAALGDLARPGARTPKVGLFYDTTTLKGVDLSTPAGKAQLYGSIRDFYSRVKPDRWARFDHRAVVVLYRSGGIVNLNGAAFRDADQRFAKEFGGTHLYFIGNTDFRQAKVPIDLTFEWGAETPAHNGVRVDHDVAVISPGSRHYNTPHTGNFGKDKLPRNNGDTYREAWKAALKSRKNVIFIETWNEFHESSGVAPTREFRTRESDTTRQFAKTFHGP